MSEASFLGASDGSDYGEEEFREPIEEMKIKKQLNQMKSFFKKMVPKKTDLNFEEDSHTDSDGSTSSREVEIGGELFEEGEYETNYPSPKEAKDMKKFHIEKRTLE